MRKSCPFCPSGTDTRNFRPCHIRRHERYLEPFAPPEPPAEEMREEAIMIIASPPEVAARRPSGFFRRILHGVTALFA